MATRNITNIVQLAENLRRIGLKLQSIANRKQRLEARIARNAAKVDADKQRLSEHNRNEETQVFALAVPAYAFAASNRNVLSNDSGKTIAADTGRIEWFMASSGKLISSEGEVTVIQEIYRDHPESFFSLVKCELRKTAIKSALDTSEITLESAYVERGEFCKFSPANTTQTLSRPVKFWDSLLEPSSSEDLGPSPR